MQTKDLFKNFEVVGVAEDGDNEGVIVAKASTMGNIDHDGDIIMPGAFKKTLAEKGAKNVRFLYQHDFTQPLGIIEELKVVDDYLEMRARFALKTQRGRDNYELAKMGAFGGMSIGFSIPGNKTRIRSDNIREINEVNLHEVSLVTFPANEMAKIQSVKQNTFERLVSEISKEQSLSPDEAEEKVVRVFKSLAEQADFGQESRNDDIDDILHSLDNWKNKLGE